MSETVDLSSIPVQWAKYVDENMEKHRTFVYGAEKAVFGENGKRLNVRLDDLEDSISDEYSDEKDYTVGDYCIYLNRLFKFTVDKPAGPWNASAVIPVSLAAEMRRVEGKWGILFPTNADLNDIVAPGNYYALGGNSILNKPPGVSGFGAEVIKSAGSSITQRVTNHNNIFVREFDSGSWGGWEQIALKGDFTQINDALIRGNGYTALQTIDASGVATRLQVNASNSSIAVYKNIDGWQNLGNLASMLEVSNTHAATVSSKLSGVFTYSKIGHVVVGQGTLTTTSSLSSGETIVSGLPSVYGNAAFVAFTTESSLYNDVYIESGSIRVRASKSSGYIFRLSVFYLS